eukprot:m.1190 g.1190  ORF g.1190 m.1190 type:complete len:403 (-) comp642_c0_seq2:56-1264(-)
MASTAAVLQNMLLVSAALLATFAALAAADDAPVVGETSATRYCRAAGPLAPVPRELQLQTRLSPLVEHHRATRRRTASSLIEVVFLGEWTSEEQGLFQDAADTWDAILVDWNDEVREQLNAELHLVITANSRVIDGAYGVLGFAGPRQTIRVAGLTLPLTGIMAFDTADVARLVSHGSFYDVILHEMGHVLGLGTLWSPHYNYNKHQYKGVAAVKSYRKEFQRPNAKHINGEREGGVGTADGHWDERQGRPTGILDVAGRDFQHELLTGWINPPMFMSYTTVSALQDLGYRGFTLPPGFCLSDDDCPGNGKCSEGEPPVRQCDALSTTAPLTSSTGSASTTPAAASTSTTGTSTIRGNEKCDDGNRRNGDGCSRKCNVQRGFECTRPRKGKSLCSRSSYVMF